MLSRQWVKIMNSREVAAITTFVICRDLLQVSTEMILDHGN